MTNIFFEQCYSIFFNECDRNNRLKLEHLMKYISDISGVAYGKTHGKNHQNLWDDGFVFVLVAMSIVIDKMPKKEDNIIIKTWEQGIKGIKFYRDYEIFDEKGKLIIKAQTIWVVVNPITRKVVKPKSLTLLFDNSDIKVEMAAFEKLKLPENSKIVAHKKINYSDIDPNNHLYNAVYGRMICDILGYEYLDKYIKRFDITFSKEALYNDVITLGVNYENNIVFVNGDIGNQKSFISRIIFE